MPIIQVILYIIGGAVFAQVPEGYYDQVNPASPLDLRVTLHHVIDDHIRFPYTASTTDTWDILEQADQDLSNPGHIVDLYKNASFPVQGGGNDFYNREHTWPKSYGFPNDEDNGDDNYPFTDCHHLFLSDDEYNFYRSNKPFRNCSDSCVEHPTDSNNGAGGGSGLYPGNSNWTSGEYTEGTWETWDGRKGDIARAMFYLAIRYEGGVHGVTGVSEPDLELTDDEDLIDASRTGDNENLAYMGMLSTLLEWNHLDPPDAKERFRNDIIYQYQGNRNPFIDHPEWADLIFDHHIEANYVYNIPHIAGTAWHSKIVVYNPTPAPVIFYLNKWDSTGNLTLFNHQEIIGAHSAVEFSNTLLEHNGVAQIVAKHPTLNVKVSFRFGETKSLTEFFVPANQVGLNWMIPNTITSWFDWFGLAIANFQDTQVLVTLEAYKNGVLISSNERQIESKQKWVGVSSSIWEGVNYADVDLVTIRSNHPIPAPVSITGNNDQDRHVFFSGQALLE